LFRLSEVYSSVQGEGPRVGEPTIFVRFAGCNLRCSGWPCDTPHAIDPARFRDEWETVPYGQVVTRVVEAGGPNFNVCFTGGEPFLQPKDDLHLLVTALMEEGYTVFEAFTNGTIELPDWVQEYIYVVMDWKLSGSGEVNDDLRAKNFMKLDSQDAIKFTIKDHNDFEEAYSLWRALQVLMDQTYRLSWERPEFFYGPVWGAIEPAQLVEWGLKAEVPWRLNLQMHNFIWDREKRGI
jgi:7-carboxy-7-deazaguanine synthase